MPGNYQEVAAVSVVQRTAAEFLRGRWRGGRRIVDHRAGVEGSFAGEAEFVAEAELAANSAPAGAALSYREKGEIRFNAHRRPGSPSLRFVPRNQYELHVTFADGRDFYDLDLRDGWTAE